MGRRGRAVRSALKDAEGAPGVARVEISPDGMRWVAEGSVFPRLARADEVAFARVAHFGNWLRIGGRPPRRRVADGARDLPSEGSTHARGNRTRWGRRGCSTFRVGRRSSRFEPRDRTRHRLRPCLVRCTDRDPLRLAHRRRGVADSIEATGGAPPRSPRNCRIGMPAGDFVTEATARLGPIDILVLNASTEIRRDCLDVADDDFDAHTAVNLRSSLLCCRASSRNGGKGLGDGRRRRQHPGSQAESAPRGLRRPEERADQHDRQSGAPVRHAASPSTTSPQGRSGRSATRRCSTTRPTGFVEEQILAQRIGIPQDCVGACLLVCSEAGAYITGTLFVDGGWHAA